jgi:hypothetical protein
MAIGDIYYDKTVLILRGDTFTDLSRYKHKISPIGAAAITTGHGSATQTTSAILCGVNTNGNTGELDTVVIRGVTLEDLGTGDYTIEIAFYIGTHNATSGTLLEWGIRDASLTSISSFDVGVSSDQFHIESINGTDVSSVLTSSVAGEFATSQWHYVTIIRDATSTRIYKGTTLLISSTNHNGRVVSGNTDRTLSLARSSALTTYNVYGQSTYFGGLRITKAARPAPTTATFSLFPTYAAQIIGTINTTAALYGWDNSTCYPDFSIATPAGSVPLDLSVGKIGIFDSNSVIPLTAETINGFATYKATFNGSMKYILSAQYDKIFSQDFTIEAWIYPTNLTGYRNIIGGGSGQLALGCNGTTLECGRYGIAGIAAGGTLSLNTWQKVAVTRIGNLFTLYINNVSVGSGTYALSIVTTGLATIGWDVNNTAGLGFIGSMAEILISTVGKTSFAPLTAKYPTSVAAITSPITKWTVTGISPTSLLATTTVDTSVSSIYTLNCPSIEPYTLTCAPKVDGTWKATTAYALGYLVVGTVPDILYVCTTAGTSSSTEPVFTNSTYTDGTVVWTKVGNLLTPESLGTRIPS